MSKNKLIYVWIRPDFSDVVLTGKDYGERKAGIRVVTYRQVANPTNKTGREVVKAYGHVKPSRVARIIRILEEKDFIVRKVIPREDGMELRFQHKDAWHEGSYLSI